MLYCRFERSRDAASHENYYLYRETLKQVQGDRKKITSERNKHKSI